MAAGPVVLSKLECSGNVGVGRIGKESGHSKFAAKAVLCPVYPLVNTHAAQVEHFSLLSFIHSMKS